MNSNAIQMLEISFLLAEAIPDIRGMSSLFLGHVFRKTGILFAFTP